MATIEFEPDEEFIDFWVKRGSKGVSVGSQRRRKKRKGRKRVKKRRRINGGR